MTLSDLNNEQKKSYSSIVICSLDCTYSVKPWTFRMISRKLNNLTFLQFTIINSPLKFSPLRSRNKCSGKKFDVMIVGVFLCNFPGKDPLRLTKTYLVAMFASTENSTHEGSC